MYSKQSDDGDVSAPRRIRTSDRLRRSPNLYSRTYVLYTPTIIRAKKSKNKSRTAASQIAKMLRPDNRSSTGVSLRRSTRKRKIPVNFECYEASSGTDDDIIGSDYRRSHRMENSGSQDDISPHNCRKIRASRLLPRREGLRPRSGRKTQTVNIESEREDASSEVKGSESGGNNGNPTVNNDPKNDGTEAEDDDEDVEDDDEDDDGGEEEGHKGRRRYDLRNRAEVRRFSMDERKQRVRSPHRVVQHGLGAKVRDVRKSGPRVHKRHRLERADDTDDSLLVDELDQGPTIPWARGGSKSSTPWLFGGLDMHGASPWGLNVAASGWGHHGDTFAALSSGIPTTGPSSKGGADIQPLQVDENLSFEDIGGLSDHINALKEMVFFPLLYPDFFASYHITPPRGVLLCGPPGTGKTMIARALACAASKAGEKVSFYMRKGADVLSKWVGEAERQLKLLFEEAQKNQPSIIFFDEIDGLAPVRSSKQEQIHNSIVSTLLALMDGLDSRGQVILIGATNRVDAIDGALRRPGRFDREFNFPLPGYEARADILDIHTRKWKLPPSEELRSELASRCVGYCGADLKALCTEAAIHAFREKYPQVYTSDDKFLVDVDSVKVRRYHFLEAMSKITAAAHRGSVVNSRPLLPIIAPCLKQHVQKVMDYVQDILPAAGNSMKMNKFSVFSNDSAVSLVYRPRLCLCGMEGVGLDHLAPAILHELEKFPVHSLGLPCLLSDHGAKTAEEALVHAFGEARRTMPSILYLPQFHLWWESAHEQLRGVLLTLLEELPSSLPILLIGTYFGSPYSMDPAVNGIFPQHTIYKVIGPSYEDRLLFFDNLITDSLSVLEKSGENMKGSDCLPELQKAPKIVTGPKPSEIKAKVEAEQHVLRRMRMCLRDVCNRILYDRRFNMFHYPVLDEDAPNYRRVVQTPMDVATLLHRVDCGEYITCTNFLRDVDLVVNNAKVYNGDDYNGARIVSRAYEFRDAVHGMLSQIDPVLLASCEKIAAQGGPSQHPENSGGVSAAPTVPVVQLAAITRASSRLRNVNVELSLEQANEVLKRAKKNIDSSAHNNTAGEENTPSHESKEESTGTERNGVGEADGERKEEGVEEEEEEEISYKIQSTIKSGFVEKSEGYGIPELERLYSKVMKGVLQNENSPFTRSSILSFLLNFVNDSANF